NSGAILSERTPLSTTLRCDWRGGDPQQTKQQQQPRQIAFSLQNSGVALLERATLSTTLEFNNELGSFGGRLELLRRRRKAGNLELHPLHPLLHPERQLDLDLHKGSDEEPVESDGIGQE
ncbi:hypothetical protein Taro_049735, partial [Colocasia esculenta]|nr:hypothetical protein [Colocasia esculenta]